MERYEDLTGKIFNNVKVLNREINKDNHTVWKCECLKCHLISIKTATQVKNYGCHCQRRNTVDQDFFEEINNSKKAYWLGFLWADGYCDPKYKKMKLDLQERDKTLLEVFKKDINFSGKITSYTAKLGKSYRTTEATVYRIAVINEKFVNDLAAKGVISHRETKNYPHDIIPKELFAHFLRGYFEGNGTISFSCKNRKIKGLNVAICGGTNFLLDIQQILKNIYGIESSGYYRRPNNPNNITIRFTKHQEQLKFLNLIYQNADTFMSRKYNKYMEVRAFLADK